MFRLSRPSNSRIKHLEEEIAKLRGSRMETNSLGSEQAFVTDRGAIAVANEQPCNPSDDGSSVLTTPRLGKSAKTDQFRSHQAKSYRNPDITHENSRNCFHGPPSAMFDDECLFKGGGQSYRPQGDVHVKSHLLAEATRQRMHRTRTPKRRAEEYLRNIRPDGDHQFAIRKARFRRRGA